MIIANIPIGQIGPSGKNLTKTMAKAKVSTPGA
jgi:hypothetical protein